MQIKTITYKRIFNAGSYESKHLEMFAEIFEGEDAEEAASRLMEKVERKVREDASQQIESEISQLKQELHDLKKEVERLKAEKDELAGAEEPNPDDIPFDSSTTSNELGNF
ncbi:hypothetical protein [Halotia branconii]|uniref:Uncharacterized protein n=1 Tax=Halotia branconii CENA392 TaxID=1539056 RepID=A0AAJ6NN81_9CYAN|nr:hypothetical protein [Halotia branconii]WGV23454.1 hypothetical protein QI031_16650 [Halotia branconii CENA392]